MSQPQNSLISFFDYSEKDFFWKKLSFLAFCILFCSSGFAQTRVGGRIVDVEGAPIPFASIVLKGSTTGTVSDENGNFYLSSEDSSDVLRISFVGFETQEISVKSQDVNLKIVLLEMASALQTVELYSGRRKNKNNPAVELLRKMWENKRKNGLQV